MRQPETGERAGGPGHSAGRSAGPPQAPDQPLRRRLPPGQYIPVRWPVLHYGGVPKVDLATWQFTIEGLVEKK